MRDLSCYRELFAIANSRVSTVFCGTNLIRPDFPMVPCITKSAYRYQPRRFSAFTIVISLLFSFLARFSLNTSKHGLSKYSLVTWQQ